MKTELYMQAEREVGYNPDEKAPELVKVYYSLKDGVSQRHDTLEEAITRSKTVETTSNSQEITAWKRNRSTLQFQVEKRWKELMTEAEACPHIDCDAVHTYIKEECDGEGCEVYEDRFSTLVELLKRTYDSALKAK